MFVAEFTRDTGKSYIPFKSLKDLVEYLKNQEGLLTDLWS